MVKNACSLQCIFFTKLYPATYPSHYVVSVFFADPPKVKLNLGKSLDRNQIVEGTDVYMDCIVRSNPKAYKIQWMQDVSLPSPATHTRPE